MILIRKNSSLLLGCLAAKSKNSALFSASHLLTPLSPFTSKAVDPSPKTLFIVNYLIDSVGLSSEEAIKASKFVTHIKSPRQPDSVLEFFRKNGFTENDIKRIIISQSRLLCANSDSTLKPKLEALRDLGFSEAQIIKLVTTNPFCLKYMSQINLRHRIELLSVFLGSNDDKVKALSIDTSFLSCSLEKKIMPNISFLRELQVSDERIGFLLIRGKNIIGKSLSALKFAANKAVELGFLSGSGMFYLAFCCLCKYNSEMVDAKIKLLGSLGFSRAEILSAVLKQPNILSLSEKNLCETVDFLVNEAGCKHSYLSRHPSIVSLSLTKRLIPRNYVMRFIKEKGFLKRKKGFYYIASISEKSFMDRFIFTFKEKMPELHDVYLSAVSGRCLD